MFIIIFTDISAALSLLSPSIIITIVIINIIHNFINGGFTFITYSMTFGQIQTNEQQINILPHPSSRLGLQRGLGRGGIPPLHPLLTASRPWHPVGGVGRQSSVQKREGPLLLPAEGAAGDCFSVSDSLRLSHQRAAYPV